MNQRTNPINFNTHNYLVATLTPSTATYNTYTGRGGLPNGGDGILGVYSGNNYEGEGQVANAVTAGEAYLKLEFCYKIPDPIEITNWTDATFNQTYEIPSWTHLKVTAYAKGGDGGGGYIQEAGGAYQEIINTIENQMFPQFNYNNWTKHYYLRGSGGGG